MLNVVFILLVNQLESILPKHSFGLVGGHESAKEDSTVDDRDSDHLFNDFIDEGEGCLIFDSIQSVFLWVPLFGGLARCCFYH